MGAMMIEMERAGRFAPAFFAVAFRNERLPFQ